jgi:gamma-glutamyltranspeptidase/glutathione hydrolase
VFLESGFPAETLKKLESMGHKLGKSVGSFGGYQGILIDDAHGTLHGATESRKDGTALGY